MLNLILKKNTAFCAGFKEILMFKTIWQYRVTPGKEDDFRRAYSGDGVWNELFSRQKGYLGTSLFQDSEDREIFLTIDAWESEASFKAFQKNFGQDYEALDKDLETLTIEEVHIGMFKE